MGTYLLESDVFKTFHRGSADHQLGDGVRRSQNKKKRERVQEIAQMLNQGQRAGNGNE